MARPLLPLPLLLLLLSTQAQSGPITDTSSADLISYGVDHMSPPTLLLLEGLSSNSTETCVQTYGFLPCTTTVLGNLFLVLIYGYLMFRSAQFLSTGSELLLELLGPGLVGGLLLPILGALPDAFLILVSGLSGSKETAHHRLLIGMGLLAGSTVLLLTMLWGSCLVVGKCDLSDKSTTIDSQDTKRFSLTGSGVTTDLETSQAAKIMTISVIPFIIVQLPLIFHLESARRLGVLIALIVAVVFLISYCCYQVFQPRIQKRRLAYAKLKHVIAGFLRQVHKDSLERLLTPDGQPDIKVITKLFKRIDLDQNGYVSVRELTALIIGIEFEEINFEKDEAVTKVMEEFDTSRDGHIDCNEFVKGIEKWLNEAKRSVHNATSDTSNFVYDFHRRTKEEHDMLIDESDEVVEHIQNPIMVYAKAILQLLLGAAIAAALAEPLVNAVTGFSNATSTPTFFVSFIVMPLANSSEAVSIIMFASRKKKRTTSLAFCQIYGGVTMNNSLCLAVFLALVYVRGLTWDFSSEVLIILIVCIVMGFFTSSRTLFRLWTCAVAFALYPLSLVLVYVLDYIFGWS